MRNKRYSKIESSLLIALFLSIIFTVGSNLEQKNTANLNNIITYVKIFLYGAALFGAIYGSMIFFEGCKKPNLSIGKLALPKYSLLIFWLCILIAWTPTVMACYPGFFTYDGFYQELQNFTGNYSNQHSVLMTWFMGSLIRIGRLIGGTYNAGIFCFSICQVMLLSYALAYLCKYICKYSQLIAFLLLIFVAIMPINSFMAISTTKDTIFTVFFVFIVIEYDKMAQDPTAYFNESGNSLKLSLLSVLACCLTHNFYQTSIAVLIIMLFVYRKWWKFIIKSIVILLFIYHLFSNVFLDAIRVEHASTSTKMVVPFQQIVRVYNIHGNEMNEAEKEKIEQIWSEENCLGNNNGLKEYNPYLADPTRLKEEAFLINKQEIFEIWVRNLKFIGTYIDSFLLNNYEFWYPLAEYPKENWDPWYFSVLSGNLQDGIINSGLDGIVPEDDYQTGNQPILYTRKYEKIKNFCMNYGNIEVSRREHLTVPIIYGCAVYFIGIHIVIIIAFVHRKRKVIVAALPTLLLMYTYLCGPAALMRYSYPIIITSFLHWGCLVDSKERIIK